MQVPTDNTTTLAEDIDHGCCGYMKKKESLIKRAESQEQEILILKNKLKASTLLVEELLKVII